jgi:hypothetical protein
MSPINSKRVLLIDVPQFSVEVEYNQDYVVLHLPRVSKFGKKELGMMKDYVKGIYDFTSTLGKDVLYVAVDDKRVERLVNLLGFQYLGSSQQYKVYRYASSTPSN